MTNCKIISYNSEKECVLIEGLIKEHPGSQQVGNRCPPKGEMEDILFLK